MILIPTGSESVQRDHRCQPEYGLLIIRCRTEAVGDFRLSHYPRCIGPAGPAGLLHGENFDSNIIEIPTKRRDCRFIISVHRWLLSVRIVTVFICLLCFSTEHSCHPTEGIINDRLYASKSCNFLRQQTQHHHRSHSEPPSKIRSR